jgi:YidC/Oxa1 family membrane protein insertase
VTAITNALTGVIEWIYGIIQNHGWSIVIFTLLIRFVLMPLDISSRKGMRKMAKIQPQITALQKKYANDKAKLQQKQSELMRKEHYNPMSGCLPLLIQMPILFAMFGAMRAVANEKIVEQVFTFLQGQKPTYEGWLWVKNLWMADSLFAPVAPNLSSIQAIGQDVWHRVWITLGEGQQQLIIQNIAQFGQSLTGALDFSSADALKAIFSSADSLKTIMPSITSAMVQMPIYIEQTALMSGFQNGINLLPLFQRPAYSSRTCRRQPGAYDQNQPSGCRPAACRPGPASWHGQLHEVFLPPVFRLYLFDQQRRLRAVLGDEQPDCHRDELWYQYVL